VDNKLKDNAIRLLRVSLRVLAPLRETNLSFGCRLFTFARRASRTQPRRMPKTLPTVAEFLAALPDDRRETITTIHQAIRKTAPKLTPIMMSGMGPSPVLGYGKYHYKYASGREGDWFLIGLVAGKKDYALHICVGGKDGYLVEKNAAKLGKVKTGRSCINFKKLEDLKLDVAMGLAKQAVKLGGISAVV
jgi:hypothetical protein